MKRLTKKRREEVVMLLRCAADSVSGYLMDAELELGGVDDEVSIAADRAACFAWDAYSKMGLPIEFQRPPRPHLLEAALLVEEGVLP